jgi:hypothetical protein
MRAASAGVTRRASTPRPPPPSRTLTRRPEPKRLSAGKGEAFRAHHVHRSIMFMSTNGLHYTGSIIWAPLHGLHYTGSIIRAPLYGLHYMGSIIRAPLYGLHYTGSIIWAPLYGLHYMGSIIRAPLCPTSMLVRQEARACLYEHACTSILVRACSYDSLASSLSSAPAAALVHGTMSVEGNGRRGLWA